MGGVARDKFSVQWDDTEFRRLLDRADRGVERAAKTFLRRAGELLRRKQVKIGTREFKDPTGQYNASIRAERKISRGEARVAVGPDKPYMWWLEDPQRYPDKVPATHRGSGFEGYQIVERSVDESKRPLISLFRKTMVKGIETGRGGV